MGMMASLGVVEWLAIVSVLAAVGLTVALTLIRRKMRRIKLLHQEERNLASRQLQSATADTRALLNQASQIILVFERHAPILLFANQQALEAFGKETTAELMDQFISRPDSWLPAPHRLIDFEDWLQQARVIGTERKEWCFRTGEDDHPDYSQVRCCSG